MKIVLPEANVSSRELASKAERMVDVNFALFASFAGKSSIGRLIFMLT